jgi:hypothetical protein
MIAVHLLDRKDVVRRLAEYGCQETGDTVEEAGFWATPWGHHFMVPELGPDRVCAEYVLDAIIASEIEATRPK